MHYLFLYAGKAVLCYCVFATGLWCLDPNRESSKKAHEQKKEIAKRQGRPIIQTNSYEDVIARDVINPDHINVEFDSIGGLETIKQALHLAANCWHLSAQVKDTSSTLDHPILTFLHHDVTFDIRAQPLMEMSAVFSLADKLQPAIIFIDEVDSFLGQRCTSDHEAMLNMKTEFMALWGRFTTNKNAQVMVLAATNRPSELDEAILRRFPQAFEIGYPDKRERAEILKVILKDERVKGDIDFSYIAGLCKGYTGSDLFDLCKKAAYFPIRELLDDEKKGKQSCEPRPLSQLDLKMALSTSRKTTVAANEYSRMNPWI
ncbi:hypothetical protein TSUD_217940, partial [Trifolium subterraneum]